MHIVVHYDCFCKLSDYFLEKVLEAAVDNIICSFIQSKPLNNGHQRFSEEVSAIERFPHKEVRNTRVIP